MNRFEAGITYKPFSEKEMLPSPKFQGIYWQGIPEEDALTGQVVCLNGHERVIDVIGFQGTDTLGRTQHHQEPTQQEDIYFIAGKGVMLISERDDALHGRHSFERLDGRLTNSQAERAKYTLAVASFRSSEATSDHEYFVLNVEVDGQMFAIEPTVTPRGSYHSCELAERSLYFVVKHRPVNN